MKSMMSDAKALRSARNVSQYCGERGCAKEECVFVQTCGFCILQATRLPEDWQLEDLKPKQAEPNKQSGIR